MTVEELDKHKHCLKEAELWLRFLTNPNLSPESNEWEEAHKQMKECLATAKKQRE